VASDFRHPRLEQARNLVDARPDGALRVLHVTPSYAPAWSYGGPTEAVYQLTRHVALAGADVRVLTTDADSRERRLGAVARRDFQRRMPFEVRYCTRISGNSVSAELLANLRPMIAWADVVHLHATFSFPTIPTLLAARVLERPVVWTLHGALLPWKHRRRQAAKRAWVGICRAAAPTKLVLHTTSDDEAVATLERFGRATAVVIPNGVETPARVESIPRDGNLRLGLLGRLDPIKGIENLLEACSRLAERRRIAFTLTVAGSGEPRYVQLLQERTRTLHLDGRVQFLGDVRGNRKLTFFQSIDVAVVPSFTENFGLVVTEALAHRVPVIAATGTPWAGVQERGCGLWVANDPDSLADAIEKISCMPLTEMGERGRRWMAEDFAWPQCARKLIACYRALLGHHDLFAFDTGAAS
jgi:glycosyltransferase involved in cell wall biosynthesis